MNDNIIFYTGVGICLLSGLASLLNILSGEITAGLALVGIFVTGYGYYRIRKK